MQCNYGKTNNFCNCREYWTSRHELQYSFWKHLSAWSTNHKVHAPISNQFSDNIYLNIIDIHIYIYINSVEIVRLQGFIFWRAFNNSRWCLHITHLYIYSQCPGGYEVVTFIGHLHSPNRVWLVRIYRY